MDEERFKWSYEDRHQYVKIYRPAYNRENIIMRLVYLKDDGRSHGKCIQFKEGTYNIQQLFNEYKTIAINKQIPVGDIMIEEEFQELWNTIL